MAVREDAAAPVGHHREHMPCLDGLRGLAAVMVVLGHASDFGFDPLVHGVPSHNGVLLFFVLSGFLMGRLYLPGRFTSVTVSKYLAARISRIVPIYYVVTIVSFCISHYVFHDFIYDLTPTQLVRNLTFNGSVYAFWSIGPEFQFYFLFLVLWAVIQRSYRTYLTNSLVTFAVLIIYLFSSGMPGILVFSKLHIFMIGVFGALIGTRLKLNSSLVLGMHLVAFILLLLTICSSDFANAFGIIHYDRISDPSFSSFYGNIPRLLISAYIVISFSYTSPLALVILANPLSAAVGRFSFSVYLLHPIIYDIMRRSQLLTGADTRIGTLFALALTIGVASLTYRFIETPARHWLRVRLLRVPLLPSRGSAELSA